MLKPKPTTIQPKPDDGRAAGKVAFNALVTMLTQGGLPPDVMQHLKNAHTALLEHVTSAPEAVGEGEGGVPLGESAAASKRREAGEDPDAKEPDDETDNAPQERAKGNKANPLRRWASAKSATDDDEEPTKAPQKKAAPGTLVRGKLSFAARARR